MKRLFLLFLFAFILIFFSCKDIKNIFPLSTYDAPFSKNNKKLTDLLGDKLTIKTNGNLVTLQIKSFPTANLILSEDGQDTIFEGRVTKYRGLYYLSHELEDTVYWIHAVKINDSLIYGLNAWAQMWMVDTLVRSGKHQSIVKYSREDVIRLHPEKKELRKVYTTIMSKTVPDTIVSIQRMLPAAIPVHTAEEMDMEENEYLSKVYPNPVTDYLTIELFEPVEVHYQLIDATGKMVLSGQFTETVNKLNMSEQPNGVYILVLVNPKDKSTEKVKVMKNQG